MWSRRARAALRGHLPTSAAANSDFSNTPMLIPVGYCQGEKLTQVAEFFRHIHGSEGTHQCPGRPTHRDGVD
eukprot:1616761-Pyramimonas_sp.AAC.1